MAKELEGRGERSPAIVRKGAAAIVLVIAGAIVVKFVIGIIGTILLLVAAVAVLWALKTLVW